MRIQHGDYVTSSRHGHTGRAYRFCHLVDEDMDWVNAQTIPVTIKQIQGEWVGILTHRGGSVLVPMSTCTKIPPIENFSHPYAKDYFK